MNPSMDPTDYARENIERLRTEINDKLDHEKRYRSQYGQMAAEATAALGINGWVKLKMDGLSEDLADMKKSQSRIFATAFALLVSTLTLLVTVIFGILTRG